ncbi:MAG: hypothetical protein JXA30_09730 [Deltaproteobacteria bacterium]|nr:hypothetical protein [Deltaproteobacteria bacterium]
MRSFAARKTDFLAACHAVQQRNVALEEIHDKGADLVLAFFRLAKNALVHRIDNQAMVKTLAQTHQIAVDFAATVGGEVAISFVDQTIFICGQLLRASRSIYESAIELGTLLERCQVSEISYSAELTQQDLLAFAEAFSLSARDPQKRDTLLNSKLNRMEARKLDTSLKRSDHDDNLPEVEKMLRAYASALMVMRRFFDRTAEGKNAVPYHVKRIAQRLVTLGLKDENALLAMTTLVNIHRDDAGRAVQSAILAVLIARRISANRAILGQLAMAALMADSGRVRSAGKSGRDALVQLPEEVEKAIPSLSSAICIASCGVNLPSALRAVIAYEATAIERAQLLGPLYDRTMSPLVQSKVIHTVRALLDRLAPRDTSRPLSPLDALAAVSQIPAVDNTIYKILVSAVGLLPTGTVVEFETGEWGVVLGPSAYPDAVDKPRIRLMTDKHGQSFSRPKEIDLGEPSTSRRYPRIASTIAPDGARFNLAGVLITATT